MTRKAPEAQTVADYWWDIDRGAEPIVLPARFGRVGPRELEIGSGRGLFLARAAASRPDVDFIGIEWSRKFSLLAAGRLAAAGLHNARILCGDARQVVPRFAAGDFQAVHVYFPDPWWKRRHGKRRLINAEFVGQIARILARDGRLFLATDVEAYFFVMLSVLGRDQRFTRLPDSPAADLQSETDYLTHFERKYRLAGKPIYRASFCRIGDS